MQHMTGTFFYLLVVCLPQEINRLNEENTKLRDRIRNLEEKVT